MSDTTTLPSPNNSQPKDSTDSQSEGVSAAINEGHRQVIEPESYIKLIRINGTHRILSISSIPRRKTDIGCQLYLQNLSTSLGATQFHKLRIPALPTTRAFMKTAKRGRIAVRKMQQTTVILGRRTSTSSVRKRPDGRSRLSRSDPVLGGIYQGHFGTLRAKVLYCVSMD
jgi:hypothetical protein